MISSRITNTRIGQRYQCSATEQVADHASTGTAQALIDAMGVCLHETDLIEFRIVRANPAMSNFTGYTKDEILNLKLCDITHPEDLPAEIAAIQKLIAGELKSYSADKRFICKDGSVRWGHLTATLLWDAEGNPFRRVSVVEDVHLARIALAEREKNEAQLRASLGKTTRYEVLIEGQLKALEMICSDFPLSTVLEKLVLLLEGVCVGNVVGSILLLDPDGVTLRHGAAPNLPEPYRVGVNGVKIGEGVGSCGTAAYRREVVVVRDIESDPLWKDYQPLAQILINEAGLRACWSVPIFGAGNLLLGTFAMYSRTRQEPDPRDLEVLSMVARTAAIAIQKKRGDNELAESEERFKALADNIPQLAWMADAQGEIFWYNRRWFDYTGTSLNEVKGWGWKSLHHPDHVDRVVAKIQKSWDSGCVWEDTFPLRGKDGKYRWFLSHAVPLRDANGAVRRWFGTNTDVTELRETQVALQESEQRFRLMADACNVLIWLSTADDRHTWFNRACWDFLGQRIANDSQLLGYIHPDDQAVFEITYFTALKERQTWELEYRLRRHDGVYRWMSSQGIPCSASSDTLSGFVACAVDITELRLKAAELEQLVEKRTASLQEANAELETLTYSIIHDFRAPLRSMQNYSQILKEECAANLTAQCRDILERLSSSSERMDRLVVDVLSYCDVLKAPTPLQPVDTGKLIPSILDSYPEFRRRRESIRIDSVLPIVLANEALLTLCISNLLSNGLKFVAPGVLPQMRIRAEPASSADFVKLVIEDNGIGLAREHWERIFLIFQRLNTSYPGTGIGLAVVKKSAQRMGARVGVESRPGHGSSFWLELLRKPHSGNGVSQ